MDNYKEQDILAEVRSVKRFFEYLTLLFTDGLTQKSRRMMREEGMLLVGKD
jgi:hypothetical protein